jgi:hypothetical protein
MVDGGKVQERRVGLDWCWGRESRRLYSRSAVMLDPASEASGPTCIKRSRA